MLVTRSLTRQQAGSKMPVKRSPSVSPTTGKRDVSGVAATVTSAPILAPHLASMVVATVALFVTPSRAVFVLFPVSFLVIAPDQWLPYRVFPLRRSPSSLWASMGTPIITMVSRILARVA